jgi:CRP-like cAMP-binding protein
MDADVLKQIPFFSELPDEEVEAIAASAKEESVAEGKDLVREGDFAYDFFIIEEGKAEVLRGEERIAELGPGDFFGEIGVLEKTQRTATVRARDRMRLVTLTHWDINRLRSRIPKTIERMEKTAEQHAAA